MNIKTKLETLPYDSSRNHDRKYLKSYISAVHMAVYAGIVSMLTCGMTIAEEAAFEWSMPDRLLENKTFAGYDASSPVPQYDPNALMLPQGGWRVNFDACASASDDTVSYRWLVDDIAVATVEDCTFSHQFPFEGVYQVTLETTDNLANIQSHSQEIIVQDWLIVALGDSFGSGEGNPIAPVSEQAHKKDIELNQRVVDITADIESALAQLSGLEETKLAKQQLQVDALAARNQAESALNARKNERQRLNEIQTKVNNDPAIAVALNDVNAKQAVVNAEAAKVNVNQQNLNNCTSFLCSLIWTNILNASKNTLAVAEANLAAAQATLLQSRNVVVPKYSTDPAIQNQTQLTAAINAKAAAVNAAQNAFNVAQNNFQIAQAQLQQAIDAELTAISNISSLQTMRNDANTEVLTNFVETLPVWTETPPSWGSAEPRVDEVVFNQATPGDALRCHRSMISGQARAALAMEQADPHTSVTLVHLSCSGATIDSGLVNGAEGQSMAPVLKLLSDEGILPGPTLEAGLPNLANLAKLESQVKAAAEVVAGREVDAIVISIGGNDVKFSDLIIDCITSEPCHTDIGAPPSQEFLQAQQIAVEQNCNPGAFINQILGTTLPAGTISFNDSCMALSATTTQIMGAALATYNGNFSAADGGFILDNRLSVLNTELSKYFPELRTRRIYLTEYPDITGDDNGNYCGWDPAQTSTAGQELKNLPGFTQAEMTWADQTVAAAIKNATESAVALNQWSLISETGENADTIRSASRNHGYCANDKWIVTMPETILSQRDQLGAVHPNRDGHEVYKQAIYTSLEQDFYPRGLDFPPRAPGPSSNSVNVSSATGSVSAFLLLFLVVASGLSRRPVTRKK